MQEMDQKTTLSFPDLIKQLRGNDGLGASKDSEIVLNSDLVSAKKIEVSDARDFFDANDRASGPKEQEEDADGAGSDDIEVGFTIDQPKAATKSKNIFSDKVVDTSTKEQAGSPEKAVNKLEEIRLKADLKHAIDKYNEIIAQAVRLQKDLESKGGIGGEIPKTNIAKILEDPRLHDPRVSSAVKSRLLNELTERLKRTEDKTESEEYEKAIKEIEPANMKVSEALDALLSKTLNQQDAERIRLSMAGLVVEDDVTAAHKQDWDAICINRKAEIDEEASESTPAGQSTDKAIELPVSAKIIDQIKSGDQSKKIGERSFAGAQDDKNVGHDNKPGGAATKLSTAVPSLVKNLETAQADQASGPEKTDALHEMVPGLEKTDAIIKPPISPTTTEPAFKEFADIGPGGDITSEDTTEHAEIDLAESKGNVDLSAADLAKIKRGDGDVDGTGVINLSKNDLETPLEIPNPTIKIKDRISELKKTPQRLSQEDYNFHQVTDVDNKPLGIGDEVSKGITVKSETDAPKESQEDKAAVPDSKNEEARKSPEPVAELRTSEEDGANKEPVRLVKAEIALPKKARLFEGFKKFLKIGDNVNAKTASAFDQEVMKTRSGAADQEVVKEEN